jgi:hypothetical protein
VYVERLPAPAELLLQRNDYVGGIQTPSHDSRDGRDRRVGGVSMSVTTADDERPWDGLRDQYVIEYGVIGAAIVLVSLPVAGGILSQPFSSAADVAAVVAAAGVGTALYGFDPVRRSASVFSIVLGISLYTAARLQFNGLWAAIFGIWAGAFMILGVASLSAIKLSRWRTR